MDITQLSGRRKIRNLDSLVDVLAMFIYSPEALVTATQTVIEQHATEKLGSRKLRRNKFTWLVGGVVLTSILALASIRAWALCDGSWLGIGHRGLGGGLQLSARHDQPVKTRPSLCGGVEVDKGFDVPSGYTLIGVRPIGQDCFALLRAQDTDASPALGLSGVADVYGQDGRLNERFFAIGQPNGQWKLFEYRRLLARDIRQARALR